MRYQHGENLTKYHVAFVHSSITGRSQISPISQRRQHATIHQNFTQTVAGRVQPSQTSLPLHIMLPTEEQISAFVCRPEKLSLSNQTSTSIDIGIRNRP